MEELGSDLRKPIEALAGLRKQFSALDIADPEYRHILKISIITFADHPSVIASKIRIDEFPSLEDLRADGATNFSSLFECLRATISDDMGGWKSTRRPDDHTSMPVVIVFTDGMPSDTSERVDSAFRKLCPVDLDNNPDPQEFEWYPQMNFFPVGDARPEILKRYTFNQGQVITTFESGPDVAQQIDSAIARYVSSVPILKRDLQALTSDDGVIPAVPISVEEDKPKRDEPHPSWKRWFKKRA